MPRGLAWLWLATLAPGVFVGYLIAQNSVDLPVMDDWGIQSIPLIRARSGQLDWETLLWRHNESRPLFPKVLFLGVGLLARGDTRWTLLVTFQLACLTSFGVFRLARKTVTDKPMRLSILMLAANLLIFTPRMGAMWLRSSYLALWPIACLVGALAVLYSGLGGRRKFVITATLCTVATFSYANGLSTWLLAAPAVALTLGRRWLLPLGLGFLLNGTLYFQGYTTPAHLPSPLSGLELARLSQYALAFLGAPLGLDSRPTAIAVGAVLGALYAVGCGYWIFRGPDRRLRYRMTPWLAIGGYALVSALAAGIGRSAFGVQQALVSRYIGFSLYLGVALLFLAPLVLDDWVSRGSARGLSRRTVQACAALGLMALLFLQGASARLGVQEMVHTGRMLRYGKTCLLFIDVDLDRDCLSHWVFPDPEGLRPLARDLDRLGYLRPGLITSRNLDDLGNDESAYRSVGAFSSLSETRGRFVAAGWAGLPDGHGPADAVVLARREAERAWVPLAFAPVFQAIPPLAAQEPGPAYRHAGWSKGLVKRELRHRPFVIGAWAFDAQTGSARLLDGVYEVKGRRERNRRTEDGL